jgi:hypothetical protein
VSRGVSRAHPRTIATAAGVDVEWLVTVGNRPFIDLHELADMEMIHGPRHASPGTYDAWRGVLRAHRPRFEFTDPPFGGRRR